MSLLKALSMQAHNSCRTGDYVFIGHVKTAEGAIQLCNIEGSYRMGGMYRGLLVGASLARHNLTATAINNVYMQDCTFVRYPSLGHRCKYFAPKKCSYKKKVVRIPIYMIS